MSDQEQRITSRIETAQREEVSQFETQLELLQVQMDPELSLQQLSDKIDDTPLLGIEAHDLSSAEIIKALQERFEDDPEKFAFLMREFGVQEKYEDPEAPENKTFIDWALEKKINTALLGALMDTPLDEEAGAPSVLKEAISRVDKPEDESQLNDYHRAILVQALELYLEVPKIKNFVEESRFLAWPYHRLEGNVDERLDLKMPKFEILAHVVQRMEGDGYFNLEGEPAEVEREQRALMDRLLAEFREQYDENTDLVKQSTLMYYEYPELTGADYLYGDGTIDGGAIKGFLEEQWATLSQAPAPRSSRIARGGQAALNGIGSMFAKLGDVFDSKDFTKKKPEIEKFASALDLGDILEQGMGLGSMDAEAKAQIKARVDKRIEDYAMNLEGRKIDEIIPPEQMRERTVEELSPEEIQEIEALFATVGPEWEGTKAQRLYEETVLNSFCQPGMPCKKTFEEFIQEDYRVSTIRRFLVECTWLKSILGFVDEKMASLVDFITEKGIPLPTAGPTPREQIAKVKENLFKEKLISEILEDPSRFAGVQIKGLQFSENGLANVPYDQLYTLQNNILGEQNQTTSRLRQQNLSLENLVYVLEQDLILDGDLLEINYGEYYGKIQIPLDAETDTMIEKLKKSEAEDVDEFVQEIARYNFINDPANTEKIQYIPDSIGGLPFLFEQGLIILDESGDTPVYLFQEEFFELLTEETVWAGVTEGQCKDLAKALLEGDTKLEFASVAENQIVVEEGSKDLLTAPETREFTTLAELVEALK